MFTSGQAGGLADRRQRLRRLRFSSDADIVRLTNARIIIIIIIIMAAVDRRGMRQ